jgi:hypothetical protein
MSGFAFHPKSTRYVQVRIALMNHHHQPILINAVHSTVSLKPFWVVHVDHHWTTIKSSIDAEAGHFIAVTIFWTHSIAVLWHLILEVVVDAA